jgi:DNA-binding transcriptional MerR regulator
VKTNRDSAIRTNAAAAMLGVSPNTLRGWERRFGYPTPRRTGGGHRQFELGEIEALRRAFEQTQDISSAVAIARERGAGPPEHTQLRAALAAYRTDRADAVLEESLALRSVERTVETVLLRAVEELDQRTAEHPLEHLGERADGSPLPSAGAAPRPADATSEFCFAWRYATGWLCAAQRVAPPASREEGVLIFDATAPLDSDALYVQALELFLRRAGFRVLSLPTELHPASLGSALRALHPSVIVLGGQRASLDAIARLIYITRQSTGDAEVLDFRGALPDTGASTVGRLGPSPIEAVHALTERLGQRRALGAAGVCGLEEITVARAGRGAAGTGALRAAAAAMPGCAEPAQVAEPSGGGATVAG